MGIAAPAQRASMPETKGPEPRPRRILLVEDDTDQRHLIAWMLRAEGCEVVEAKTGVELLEWIGVATTEGSERFDAIVSDVNMPDLTAIEVLSAWRYGGWPAPLILVTASDDPRLRCEANLLGVIAVLAKPVRPDDLREALRRAFVQPGPSGERLHSPT